MATESGINIWCMVYKDVLGVKNVFCFKRIVDFYPYDYDLMEVTVHVPFI